MPKRTLPDLADELLVALCARFVKGEGPQAIGHWLQSEHKIKASRQQLGTILKQARLRHLFALHPPRQSLLEQRITDIYGIAQQDRVAVVPARGKGAAEYVATEAAALVVRLIKQLARHKQRVHLGLGAGFTTRTFVQRLTDLLRSDIDRLPLTLHALTSGFEGDSPSVAPLAFFGLFDALGRDIEYVGLFAPSFVRAAEYEQLKRDPGMRKSFAARSEVDIVVTSLASAHDDHGALKGYLLEAEAPTASLQRAGWIGDVLYRPYSVHRPLMERTGLRAVTLFELSDLAAMARSGKYVVLLSGPCGRCRQPRTPGLRPLLSSPDLAVWTHVVMDLQTAEELIPSGSSREEQQHAGVARTLAREHPR